MKNKKKILLIRFSSIGDIVLTSPIVRCLHLQLDAEIHFVVKKKFAGLVRDNPYIKKVIAWEDESAQDLLAEMEQEHYTAIVDLHKNIRSYRIRKRLKRSSFDFDKLNLEKWLMVRLKWNRLPAKHLVDRYFEGIARMGIKNDGKGLDFFIPEATATLEEIVPDAWLKAGYLCLVLGAAHFTKQIPISKLTEICAAIPGKIILLGGGDEKKKGDELKAQFPEKILNLAGITSINESARVIKAGQLLITPDTGMMHIGAALKKRILTIWGNTIPEFGMYPYLPQGVVPSKNIAVENIGCRPCSKIGKTACPKGHFNCMQSIRVAEIMAAIDDHISQH